MRHPGVGSFRREGMPKTLRHLAPHESLSTITDVDLESLWLDGRRLILLDVDNTLVIWKSEEIEPGVKEWLAKGKGIGFQFCILSNTRHPARLERISKALDIPFLRGKFKPHPEMYLEAMAKFKMSADATVMIGDQLLTDVLGANRSGIDAIWVQRISSKEFVGTKVVSRNVERLVGVFLHRWFQSDENASRDGFFQRSVVKQLIKFGVVGGTATIVDLGPHYWLMTRATWNGASLRDQVGSWVMSSLGQAPTQDPHALSDAAWLPTKIVPVLLAIMVSYLLNFMWTFKSAESKMNVKQAAKFYIVALIGMAISVAASTLVKKILHGSFLVDFSLASLAGIVAGFAWNFNAQRIWTFKAHKE